MLEHLPIVRNFATNPWAPCHQGTQTMHQHDRNDRDPFPSAARRTYSAVGCRLEGADILMQEWTAFYPHTRPLV